MEGINTQNNNIIIFYYLLELVLDAIHNNSTLVTFAYIQQMA